VKNSPSNGFRIGYWLSLLIASNLALIFRVAWFGLVMMAFLIPLGLIFEILLHGQRKHHWWGPEPVEEEDDDLWEFPPELDINTMKPSTTDYDFVHFPKNKEDDLE